ncbi:MAG: response regulator transcription factor [Chloroflexales bacterium]
MTSAIRVLIVDDDAPFRRLLRMVLAAPDIEIVGEAANGAMAVDAARRLRPDLVLIDYNMPVMNGLDASRQIANAAGGPAIVMLTSDISPELCAAARHVGVRDVLYKGISINTLSQTVLTAASFGARLIERAA